MGLSEYVRKNILALEREDGGEVDGGASSVLTKLHPGTTEKDEERVVYDAIRAVATQIPREGHSVVGFGTYRDARSGWTRLAREYATLSEVDLITKGDGEYGGGGGSQEAGLFLKCDGVFSQVEYNGDADEAYLKEAGGAMARFFFL